MNYTEYSNLLVWIDDFKSLPVQNLLEYQQLKSKINSLEPVPLVESMPIDLSKLVGDTRMFPAGRYDRFEQHTVFTSSSFTFSFQKVDINAGGALRMFNHPSYGCFISKWNPSTGQCDAPILRGTVNPTVSRLNVVVTLGTELDGIYCRQWLPIDSSGNVITGTECYPKNYFWIDRNGTAKDFPFVIYQNDDFEWTHTYGDYTPQGKLSPKWFAWIAPKSLVTPKDKSLPRVDTFTPFSTALSSRDIRRIDLIPAMDEGNRFDTCTTDRGIVVTDDKQGYFQDAYLGEYSKLALIDGPRGVGRTTHTTHIQAGRNNKWYFSSPVSWRVVDSTGAMRTLFGVRHKYAPYYGDLEGYNKPGHPAEEIVGDWDTSIPLLERRPLRSWFGFFDPDTVVVDQNSQLVGTDPPEHTHAVNPTAFVGDAHGYVLRAEFNGQDRAVPAKVTRFIKCDPSIFGGALYNGVIYIAERNLHRISKWDVKTGAYLGDLVSDPGSSIIGKVILPNPRLASNDTFQYNSGYGISEARARALVCPEGLAVMDDWLYVGSVAMAQVLRFNLVTGQRQVAVNMPASIGVLNNRVHFINLAVSDGSFGPKHTVFTCHFDNGYYGRPLAFLPVPSSDGLVTNSKVWDWAYWGWDIVNGPGNTMPGIYPMAIGINSTGALAVGGTDEYIHVYRQRRTDEPLAASALLSSISIGHRKWMDQGLYLPYGKFGNGPLSYQKGKDPDIDLWLSWNGR